MAEYITKTNKKEEFESGALRDSQEGKPRFDLIPPLALKRIADLYARGAAIYGESNWANGIKYNRLYSSALRHLIQFGIGKDDEDHLSAVVFNLLAIIHFEEMGRNDLDDMPKWIKKKVENI